VASAGRAICDSESGIPTSPRSDRRWLCYITAGTRFIIMNRVMWTAAVVSRMCKECGEIGKSKGRRRNFRIRTLEVGAEPPCSLRSLP